VVVRFWASVLAFHVLLAFVTLRIARRQHTCRGVPGRPWLGGLGRDAVVFVLVAVVAGLAASSWAPMPGFTAIRLGCQALFGEAVVLCGWLTADQWRAERRGRAALPALAVLVLIAVYGQAYHREPRQLHVRRHELRLAPETPAARRLRILHLTDIQAATIGAHEERALRTGMREQPDLIVFTGDYIHERVGAPTGREAARDFRALIRAVGLTAPLGVWATEGDVGFDCGTMFDGLPVRCMVDDCALVKRSDGSHIALAGLSTGISRGHQAARTREVVESCPPAELSIVVAHRPDFVANLVGPGHVDLALAGHTHGGQVVLPFFGPPLTLSRLPRRFAADLNDYEGIPLHVSRGVGMERGPAPQIRFLCPPEICIIDVWY
jgi:predicted MPP superfamily phosphohydrolase